jgi:hypothetical protein
MARKSVPQVFVALGGEEKIDRHLERRALRIDHRQMLQ